MRQVLYPLLVGAFAGAFMSFGVGTVLVSYAFGHGLELDLIAKFFGAGFGAAIAVIGALFLETWKKSRVASAKAMLVLADLSRIEVHLAECANLAQILDKGGDFGDKFDAVAARAEAAEEKLEVILHNAHEYIPELVVPGMRLRNAFEIIARLIRQRSFRGAPLVRGLAGMSLKKDMADGRSALMAMGDICRRHL